jgi:hypothetical protein
MKHLREVTRRESRRMRNGGGDFGGEWSCFSQALFAADWEPIHGKALMRKNM